MASLKANVKVRDNKYIVIHHRNQLFGTGVRIDTPEEFNTKEGKLSSRYKGKGDYRELNNIISDKLSLVNSLISDAFKKGVDSKEYINLHFDKEQKKLSKLSIQSNTPLYVAYGDYINTKISKMKDINKDSSMDSYKTEVSRLEDYNKYTTSTLSDLQDAKWFHDFIRFLAEPHNRTILVKQKNREFTKTIIQQQTNSTIKRFLQDIITFLKGLEDTELKFPIKDISVLMNSLKTRSNNPENVIAMEREEWNAVKNFKPTKEEEPTLDAYKFCTCCGLRNSDFNRLYSVYVKDRTINMIAQKTSVPFSVRMNDEAYAIYLKYDCDFRGKFPKEINTNLKKILKQIPEFQKKIIDNDYVLQKVVEIEVPAWKVFTFHSSRRTFASFAIQNGCTIIQLRKMTGWKDSRTIDNYLKVYGSEEMNESILNF